MPLLDHFNPPLSRTHPWRSFHGAWAAAMARLLNQGVLPPGYYAVPLVNRDGPVEIDVAALREHGVSDTAGGVAAAPAYTPPAPAFAAAVELPSADDVEVHVFADDGGDPRLAAAVELVSPRNKDRPQARQAFAAKCVDYLQRGSGVVVVDTVTTRRADLNAAVLALLDVEAASANLPAGLSAVAYRAAGFDPGARLLQLWPVPLALGRSLSKVPLWIAADYAVPLDLDASYATTCADLRVRQAG
jgi:hypothetical protein